MIQYYSIVSLHLSPMAVHAPPMAIRKADCRLSHLLKYEVDVNIISMDYSLHAYFERSKRCGLETVEGSGQADFLSPSTPLSANTKRTPSTLRAQSSQLRYSPVRPSLDCWTRLQIHEVASWSQRYTTHDVFKVKKVRSSSLYSSWGWPA